MDDLNFKKFDRFNISFWEFWFKEEFSGENFFAYFYKSTFVMQ